MDAKERTHLRALCEAATPGPWDAIYDEDAGEWMVRAGHADVAVLTWQQALDALGLSPVTRRTAAFIAASRAAIPALLDALDAAERERDEARAETADLRATVDTMQVQLDAHREWLATAQATGAEAERLREQVRVWRTLACEGAISSRDLVAEVEYLRTESGYSSARERDRSARERDRVAALESALRASLARWRAARGRFDPRPDCDVCGVRLAADGTETHDAECAVGRDLRVLGGGAA